MPNELQRFVHHARERGLGLVDIRLLLTSAGWKDKRIAEAFLDELDLLVPEPTNLGSARDTFLHLLAFTALYTWIVSLILLVFTFVDLAFPDPAWWDSDSWREGRYSSIRAGLAAIVVAYPAFIALWWYSLVQIRRDPETAKRPIRRWLTYLSLFVGAVTLAADLITLVYFLFEGELSVRFLLKALTLFLVTGAGLCYLSISLRTAPKVEQ